MVQLATAAAEQHRTVGSRLDPAPAARVLVVDDSAVARHLVGAVMRRAGHDVVETRDAAEALDALVRERFDVVVTDLSMPGRTGFDLIEETRRVGDAPEVIVLTGTHRDDVRAAIRALRLGAHDFLTKPPDAEELALAVERAAEKRRLREENARLMRLLHGWSYTDALTGVGNRRAFDEALAREVARCRRHGSDLVVVIADLDNFKRVNDALGHRAGDEVLRAFACRIRAEVRAQDATYRYGGEEFAVLLPETTLAGGATVARRLVSAVAVEPFRVGPRHLRITCSAGVAALCGTETGEELVARADGALYAAKQGGRNRAQEAGAGRTCSRRKR